MKKSKLRQIIKEEISKVLNEEIYDLIRDIESTLQKNFRGYYIEKEIIDNFNPDFYTMRELRKMGILPPDSSTRANTRKQQPDGKFRGMSRRDIYNRQKYGI